jgi:hypothetical protein
MPRLIRKPGGINTVFDPVYGEIETHSSTCRHCQHITDFPSRKVMMDYVRWCYGCDELACLEPECVKKGCMPYEKQAEIQENEYKLRSRIHLQAWRCY